MPRPKKFAANMPVASSTASTTATLKPGMSKPNNAVGDKKAGTTLSSVLTTKPSTQIVMTTGTQISKPVTKYFFRNRMLGSKKPFLLPIAATRGIDSRFGHLTERTCYRSQELADELLDDPLEDADAPPLPEPLVEAAFELLPEVLLEVLPEAAPAELLPELSDDAPD